MVYVIRVREFQIEVPGLALLCVTLRKSLLKWAKYCLSRELAIVSEENRSLPCVTMEEITSTMGT